MRSRPTNDKTQDAIDTTVTLDFKVNSEIKSETERERSIQRRARHFHQG